MLLQGAHLLAAGAEQVFGQQQVKVGVGDPQHQVLAGGLQVDFPGQHQRLALVMADHVLPAQQRLDQHQCVGIGVVAIACRCTAVVAVDPSGAPFK
ncbi:hypothetical protein D9M71_519690 [compost metagenome]